MLSQEFIRSATMKQPIRSISLNLRERLVEAIKRAMPEGVDPDDIEFGCGSCDCGEYGRPVAQDLLRAVLDELDLAGAHIVERTTSEPGLPSVDGKPGQ